MQERNKKEKTWLFLAMVEDFNIVKFNIDKKESIVSDEDTLGCVERMGGETTEIGAAPRGQRYKKGGQTKWLD